MSFPFANNRAQLENAPPWVLARADIDLDFANGRYFQRGQSNVVERLLTCSRASTGYVQDQNGIWKSVGSNLLRVGLGNGLLVEEARTNSIRNNSMQGAVAGTPGTLPTNWTNNGLAGLTQTVVGTGTINGIEYIDLRASGTTSGTLTRWFEEPSGIIAASNGQTWNLSRFLALVGGDFTNVSSVTLGIREQPSAVQHEGSNIKTSLTSSLQRFETAQTNNQAGTTSVFPVLTFTVTNGAAVDFTIRIGWPQLELGAFATSPIRTTNAAVTRAADIINVANTPVIGSGFSALVNGFPISPITNSANQNAFDVSDGTSSNSVHWRRANTTGIPQIAGAVSGSGFVVASGAIAWAQNTSGKFIIAYANNDQATSFNGGTVATSNANALPGGLNKLSIGIQGNGAVSWSGYISRVVVWPNTRLPNATLQALTQ